MYSNDPIYPDFRPVKPVRIWPWVLVGLVVAVLLWASFEPIPHVRTNAERIWYCQTDLHC